VLELAFYNTRLFLLSVDVSFLWVLCFECERVDAYLLGGGHADGRLFAIAQCVGRETRCLIKLIVIVLARELMLLLKFGCRDDLWIFCACVGNLPPSFINCTSLKAEATGERSWGVQFKRRGKRYLRLCPRLASQLYCKPYI
jgi:hypothetical protein